MRTDADLQTGDDAPSRMRTFTARSPLPELTQRLAATASLVLVGLLAVVFGFHFQHTFDIYKHGKVPSAVAYQAEVDRLLGIGRVTLLVVVVSMMLWSATVVFNATRVAYSLRSVWIAAGGWVLVVGAPLLAHAWLDKTLNAGMLAAGFTFLAVLYVPHGTIAGATSDLGGNGYLARVWFLLEFLAAILLWAALSGVSAGLPTAHPQTAMQEKAFLCFVSGLLLFAAAALFFAVARNMSELTHHKWVASQVGHRSHVVPNGSIGVTRSASFTAQRPIRTWPLRIAVCIGIAAVNAAAVAVTFVSRRQAISAQVHNGATAAHPLLVSSTHTFNLVIAAGLAVRGLYVVWAIIAAMNARRRTLLAPSAWTVAASFLAGTVLFALGSRLNDTVGVTGLIIASAFTYVGYIVGQLLLGRSLVALGRSGRIFMMWLIVDFGLGATVAYVSRLARNEVQLITFGGLLAGLALLSTSFAWLAMSRMDEACRAESSVIARPLYWSLSRSLTSSHN